MKKVYALAFLLLSSVNSHAVDFANVPDTSAIKWQMAPEGVVFFRNLNEVDPSFLGCCYNYSLDIKTPAGKAMWATILLKMASSKPISIGVNDKAAPSAVVFIGNH